MSKDLEETEECMLWCLGGQHPRLRGQQVLSVPGTSEEKTSRAAGSKVSKGERS